MRTHVHVFSPYRVCHVHFGALAESAQISNWLINYQNFQAHTAPCVLYANSVSLIIDKECDDGNQCIAKI